MQDYGRKLMKKQLESDLQKAVIEWLEYRRYVVVRFNNAAIKMADGNYRKVRRKGISDLLICSPSGRFIALELKRPGGKPTPEQISFINDIRANQGLATVAYSLEEVISFIENYEAFGLPEL